MTRRSRRTASRCPSPALRSFRVRSAAPWRGVAWRGSCSAAGGGRGTGRRNLRRVAWQPGSSASSNVRSAPTRAGAHRYCLERTGLAQAAPCRRRGSTTVGHRATRFGPRGAAFGSDPCWSPVVRPTSLRRRRAYVRHRATAKFRNAQLPRPPSRCHSRTVRNWVLCITANCRRWRRAALRHFNEPFPNLRRQAGCQQTVGIPKKAPTDRRQTG